MKKQLTIYHGSKDIIYEPKYGEGKKTNDFGLGFYCTLNNDLAKEWAVSSLSDGYSNCYTIDTAYLRILNLNSKEYSILNWMAVLVENRVFTTRTPMAKKARQYLIDNFGVNVNAYDIIIGYRADDSYYDFADSFLNNNISINQLSKAMRLGKLGEQIVIKSKYAFSLIKFQSYEVAEKNKYYVLRINRNNEANNNYLKLLNEEDFDDLYILDIMRGGIKNDDPRIPRNTGK